MTATLAILALALFDAVAGLLIFYALMTHSVIRFPKWHRLYIAIGGAGMLCQSVILVARMTGDFSGGLNWLWAAKDLCIGGIAFHYILLASRLRRTGLN